MRAIRKQDVRNLYKVTCKDVKLILSGKYKKKLGSFIVKQEHIILTPTQIRFLTTLECKGKVLIGYLEKVRTGLYRFIDLETVMGEYYLLDTRECCKKCLDKILASR